MNRLLSLALALLFTVATAGAEWLLCAPLGRSAATHVCCKDMQMVVTADEAASCCALSQQTRERAPVEPRMVQGPSLPVPVDVVARQPDPSPARHPGARGSVSRAPAVPLYVQQRSLLI